MTAYQPAADSNVGPGRASRRRRRVMLGLVGLTVCLLTLVATGSAMRYAGRPGGLEVTDSVASGSCQSSDSDGATGESGDGLPFGSDGWARIRHDARVFGGDGDQAAMAVAVGPCAVIAVGVDLGIRDINEDDLAVVWTSEDGLEWERAAETIVDASMTDVVWFEPAQTFVAVGRRESRGGVWMSADGAGWEQVATLDHRPAGGIEIRAVSLMGDRLVAVGQEWLGEGAARPAAWTSSDGRDWVTAEVVPADPISGHDSTYLDAALVDVADTGAGLVAVGYLDDGIVRTSSMWRSPTGDRWTLATSGDSFRPNVEIEAIAGHDGRLVAVGRDPTGGVGAWTSTDGGDSWNPVQLRHPPDQVVGLADIEVSPAGWLAVGANYERSSSTVTAAVWTSHDGLEWSRAQPMVSDGAFDPDTTLNHNVMTAVALTDRQQIAVGYQGKHCAGLHQGCELDAAIWTTP